MLQVYTAYTQLHQERILIEDAVGTEQATFSLVSNLNAVLIYYLSAEFFWRLIVLLLFVQGLLPSELLLRL